METSGVIPSRSYVASYWDWNHNIIYLIGGKGVSGNMNDIWSVANLPSTAPPSQAPTNVPTNVPSQPPSATPSTYSSLMPVSPSPTVAPTRPHQIGLSLVATTGNSFTARSGSAVAFVFNSNYILIFGGKGNTGYLSDVWKLDSSSKLITWQTNL